MIKHALELMINLASLFVRGRHSFNVIALAIVIALLAVGQAQAQDDTWMWNGSVSNDWDYYENWDPKVFPGPPDDSDQTVLIFPDVEPAPSPPPPYTNPNSGVTSWTLNRIEITAENTSFEISGSTLSFRGAVPAIRSISPQDQEITNVIEATSGVDLTVSRLGAGELKFSGQFRIVDGSSLTIGPGVVVDTIFDEAVFLYEGSSLSNSGVLMGASSGVFLGYYDTENPSYLFNLPGGQIIGDIGIIGDETDPDFFIDNQGTITGVSGVSIDSRGITRDIVSNLSGGTINGDILLGLEDDFLTLETGSTFNDLADGGPDVDTLTLSGSGMQTANLDNFVNFENLIKDGSSEWTVVGTGSFPGGTIVEAGSLIVDGNLISTTVDLNGSSAAVVNRLISSTNFNVNDTSSLIVNDLGTVVAEVNVGPEALLELFGTINGNVVNAGQFQGTGTVQGNVINSGLVSPGTSIGALTLDGNYAQNASGTLRIEVAGASRGQYDLLAVRGRANLAGRLQLVRTDDFQLQVGDQISFLTADGGVSGTFDTVENNFLATDSIVVLGVEYLPNRVVLEGVQGSFAVYARDFCGTPNAVAVGQALDSVVGDSCASKLIDYLNEQPLTDLCEDLDLISPEQLSSIFVLGASLANVQTTNLERRMHDIRSGSTGFSSAGFAVSGSGLSLSEGFAGVTGVEGKSGPPVYEPIPENRWGVFLTGLGEFTNVDGNFNASGYDLSTGGFTMGVDYRIGSNFALGLTAGYTYTGTDLVNDSNIDVNGGKFGLYATAFSGGFYLDTAVVGGVSGYDTHRTALGGSANGDTTGGDLNVLLAGGYDWKTGGFSFGPTASFQYTLVGFDSFSETGSLAPLYYPSQDVDSYRTAIGMRASYDWKIGNVLLIPEFSASWQHEFGDTEYSLVSSFASGAGNSFAVTGPDIGRDSLLLGAGFAVQWNDRVSSYAYYDGELFRTNYLSNNVSVGIRVSF